MSVHSIRAFSDPKYTYYRLTRDLGELKEGAIFYHDPDDSCLGSPAQGCLKLCWASNGNCYRYCGGAVIFHWDFVNSDLFEKIDEKDFNILINSLSPGKYELVVENDGSWYLA